MALTKVIGSGVQGIANASDATFLTATSGEGVTLAGTLAVTGVHTVGENAIFDSEGGAVTQNLVQGLCKMWAHIDHKTENSIDDSLNVSSVADQAGGKITVTATNAMATINYTSTSNGHNGTTNDYNRVVTPFAARTTTVVSLAIALTSNNALEDAQDLDVVNHGDLA